MAARAGVRQQSIPSADTGETRELDHRQIEERAYQIYLERGGQSGTDIDDWLQAEAELRRESSAQAAPGAMPDGRR